jgi:hypothetical protein
MTDISAKAFYELFCSAKEFCVAFSKHIVCFCNFRQIEIDIKAAGNMLVKMAVAMICKKLTDWTMLSVRRLGQ